MSAAKVKAVVRVVVYLRISDSELGVTPEADRQFHDTEAALNARYGADGWTLVARLYDHDRSAWDPDVLRPAFDEAMSLCSAGACDVLAAWAADRIYRRTETLSHVIDCVGDDPELGVKIVTVADGFVDLTTSTGRMHARIMAAVGQNESDRKSDRILSAVAQAVREGYPLGSACYGYKVVTEGAKLARTLEQVPEEADGVRRLVALLTLPDETGERLTLAEVAERMNEEGWPRRATDRGPWTENTIRKLMACHALMGVGLAWPGGKRRCIKHGVPPEIYVGNWTAIIPPATWDAIRDDLADPERKHKRIRGTYWLRGALVGENGKEMTGGRSGGAKSAGPGYARRIYRAGPGGTTIDADAVEAFALKAVGDNIDALTVPVNDDTAPTAAEDAVTTAQAALDALAAERAENRGTDDEMTDGEWRAARGVLVRKLNAAKAELAKTTRVRKGPGVKAHDLAGRWKLDAKDGGLTDAERYRVTRWALGTVVVAPSKGGNGARTERAIAARLSLSPDSPLGAVVGSATPEATPIGRAGRARPGRGTTGPVSKPARRKAS